MGGGASRTQRVVRRVIGAPIAPDEGPVLDVADMPTSPEALLMGLVLGGVSGLLLAAACSLLLGQPIISFWPVVTFLLGWLLSTWLFSRDTGRPSVVLLRSAVLGAAEWLGMALLAPNPVAAAASGEPLAPLPIPVRDLPHRLAGGPAEVMTWVSLGCALVCAVWVWLSPREPASS